MQRSRWLHGLWLAMVAGSAVLVLLWGVYGAGYGQGLWLRMGIAVVLWLLCARLGWQALQRLPQGVLRWSGRDWAWNLGGQPVPLHGVPVVLLDLQWLLVLRFTDGQQRTQRAVLQKNWAPGTWADLRRAVYSSAHPPQNAASSEVQ